MQPRLTVAAVYDRRSANDWPARARSRPNRLTTQRDRCGAPPGFWGSPGRPWHGIFGGGLTIKHRVLKTDVLGGLISRPLLGWPGESNQRSSKSFLTVDIC